MVLMPSVGSYRYMDYSGFKKTGTGSSFDLKDFNELQSSAIGWISDHYGRLLYMKDDRVEEPLSIYGGDLNCMNRRSHSSTDFLRKPQSKHSLKISEESKKIAKDPYFPGFSFWNEAKSQTSLQYYGHYWGIHFSGLVIFGCGSEPFRFNENLWQQFHVLITFSKSGKVIRLFNDQNVYANNIIREINKKDTAKQSVIQNELNQIECDFLEKNGSFASRYELLDIAKCQIKMKKIIKSLSEETIFFGSDSGLKLLNTNNFLVN